MVGPVLQWQDELAASMGLTSNWWIMSIALLGSITLLPAILLGLAGSASQSLSSTNTNIFFYRH